MDWLSWLDKGRWDNKYRADEKTLIDSLTTNKLEHKERDDGVEMGEINSDLKTGKRNNKKDTTERFTAHSPKFHRDIIQPREHKGDSVPKMDELNISIADSMKSWESWLDKKNRTINDDFPKGKPPHIDYNKTPDKTIPRTIRAFEDEKDDDPMVYDHKTASWESWLDKNNGIERDHKKEDKHEWDGKFSSSTIRDDAENDDDKAIGEEESLEELTDGKLEEIEKLKSWEVFLKANLNQYPDDNPPQETDKDGDTIINYETGTKLNTDGTTTDPKNRKIEDESSSDNLTDRYRKGGAGRKEDDTGKGGRGRKGGQSRGGGSSGEGEISYQDTERNSDGSHNVTEQGTRAEMRHFNKLPKLEESVKPSKVGAINSTQPASDDDKALADTQDVGTTPVGDVSTPPSHTTPKTPDSIRKLPTSVTPKIASWEVFLEKGLAGAKKVLLTHRDPDPEETDVDKIMSNAELAGKTIQQKRASWEEWVEKMQGAGDARYGNQHLTGMEQHPVADDESMELSAETDENNEKQEEKEDKGDKDNKPYKALSHE